MAEGRDVALAWLLGTKPRLDEDLPVLVIQQQRTREVLGAAEAFVEDAHTECRGAPAAARHCGFCSRSAADCSPLHAEVLMERLSRPRVVRPLHWVASAKLPRWRADPLRCFPLRNFEIPADARILGITARMRPPASS